MYASTLPRSNWLRRASIRLAWYRHMPASSLSLLWIKYFLQFSVPCPKTPTVTFTSVLVLILRTSLFVNVRTSSLIHSMHQIVYYVVQYMVGSAVTDEFWIVFSFPYYEIIMFVYYVRLFCLILFSATTCLVKQSCIIIASFLLRSESGYHK